MMRFARAALLPLLLLCVMAGSASAWPFLYTKQIPFRHVGTTYKQNLFSGTAGYDDSTIVTWNSSAGQAALVADTSVWFPLERWSVSNFPVFADSIPLLTMLFGPAGGLATVASSDSFDFVLQGSLDGNNVAASAPAIDIVELNSKDYYARIWNTTRLGALHTTATNVNMYGFPLYRIIVKDFTGTTGSFVLNAMYWKEP